MQGGVKAWTHEPLSASPLVDATATDRLAYLAASLTNAEFGWVGLLNEHGQLRSRGLWPGENGSGLSAQFLAMGSCVLETPEGTWSSTDLVGESALPRPKADLHAFGGVALRREDGEAVGVLSAACRHPRPWSEQQLDLLRALAEQALHPLHVERRSPSSGPARCVAIDRAVTPRRTRERELAASEERFRLLASLTSDAIYDWDIETDRLVWYQGIEAISGVPVRELEPGLVAWSSRLAAEDRERVMASQAAAFASTATAWTADYGFVHSSGRVIPLRDRGRIIRDASGHPVRMIGGMSDLTEDKAMEQQILRSQRMETFGSIAGGIAHDLNNALSPILLNLDGLRSETDPAERASLLESTEQAAQRGATMVRQLLAFARGHPPQRRGVNAATLLEELARFASDTFSKTIDLQLSLPPRDLVFEADETQLHQLLLNLLVNARDALPGGGHIRLEAELCFLDELDLLPGEHTPRGDYVAFTVGDDGHGMPPEVYERAAEPFFTTKAHGKGTGLGLSTVHAIASGHGGFLRIRSAEGHGTSVKVFLPATPGAETKTIRTRTEPPRGDGLRVLIVDDETALREAATRTAAGHGYKVIEASNGAEALMALGRDSVDLAFVDLMMPVMDGFTTLEVLRRTFPQLPLIGTSGRHGPEDVMSQAGIELHGWLDKPYVPRDLLQILARASRGARNRTCGCI